MGELMDKTSGKAKEAGGVVTGDRRLEAEGKAQHARGTFKERWEHFKLRVRETFRRAPARQPG
ncbi:MAG TPA: CsbD family protein [Myxococcaceae bacterium]|jgi:uncharacterized protein YjbJ (UPF0337 family)